MNRIPRIALDLDLENVAESIAARIRRTIASQPHGKWNRSGTLVQSLKAVPGADGDAAVTVSSDRLERDPELARKFFDEVMPKDLDADARRALGEAVHDAIKFDGGKR